MAINGTWFKGNIFDCSVASSTCYKQPTDGVYSTTIQIMNGDVKTGFGVDSERVIKLSGEPPINSSISAIPIDMAETIHSTSEFYNMPKTASDLAYHALGSKTSFLDSKKCKYQNDSLRDILLSAIGYSDKTIMMLASDTQGNGRFSAYQQVCTIFKDNHITDSVALDGSLSSQLVLNGQAAINNPTPRYVANAIGLVPISTCLDKDDDHDNVNNCNDICPKTPTGATVNTQGCWVVNILFDSNQYTIKPVYYPLLDKTATILKNSSILNVEVQGHTDSDGSEANNLVLSQRRADAVKNYLAPKAGKTVTLTAKGYGESKPICPANDTPTCKQANRRVLLDVK